MRENRRPPRISTGLRTLDAALDGGIGRGEFVVLAAPTGRGKSSLALNIGSYAALTGDRGVLIVSVEMSSASCAERILCAEARVSLTARMRGLDVDEIQRLSEATRRIAAAKL